MFDNHLHTIHSFDSQAEPCDVIAAGKAAGLSGVVFTDHWDIGYESINAGYITPSEYSRCGLRDLRSLTGFRVLCGIELGPMTHVLDTVEDEMLASDFDFVMLSAHYVEDVPQLHYAEFFARHTKKEAYDRYLATLLRLITYYCDYDALGHFDYIARYSPYDDPSMRYRDHADRLDELFTELINQGKALEINTATYKKLGPRFPFDREILLRYRALGGELVCLGSDAHQASGVGGGFDEFREILLGCGQRSTVHYEERRPVFERL